ncbi:MAG: hypothetical protein APF84_13665 [Gracilibacter sp. BRH_c7a]|nr:MAG: hypothetical protein APF84_13665 [Gracilibacter sp. BRH_c7a]
MAIDLKLFGSKLSRYREQIDYTINDLSVASGINEQRLIELEKGIIFPTGDEVLIFADIFKCDYKFFVSNQIDPIFDRTETFFRMHGNNFSKEDRKAILEFLFLCECEHDLLNALNKQFSFISYKPNKIGDYFKGHAIKAASDLRNKFHFEKNELPLDVFKHFRKLGIHIFRRKLTNSNISGLFIKHPDAGKCILINYDEDFYRQRFTVAHEIGHAILDDDDSFNVSFYKWGKSSLSEIRANTFASNFLIPKDFLIKVNEVIENWTVEKVTEWANKMKVNIEPLVIALKESNFINNKQANSLKSYKISRTLKEDPELLHADTENQMYKRKYLIQRGLTSYYVGLCFEAYGEGHISSGRLAEMLLCSKDELLKIADIFGGIIYYG